MFFTCNATILTWVSSLGSCVCNRGGPVCTQSLHSPRESRYSGGEAGHVLFNNSEALFRRWKYFNSRWDREKGALLKGWQWQRLWKLSVQQVHEWTLDRFGWESDEASKDFVSKVIKQLLNVLDWFYGIFLRRTANKLSRRGVNKTWDIFGNTMEKHPGRLRGCTLYNSIHPDSRQCTVILSSINPPQGMD